LIHEEVFLLDLNVIAQKECNSELKEDEEVNSDFKTFFSYPQASNPEGCMAEDENIQVIFVHHEFLGILAAQNGIKIPVPVSREGAAFRSKNMCRLSGVKEKWKPIDICLNRSSFLD
jgi:hypothetical protein